MIDRQRFKFDNVEDITAHMYNKGIDVAFSYFESRVCSSCKELVHDDNDEMWCAMGVSSFGEINLVESDFGCNKHESKE